MIDYQAHNLILQALNSQCHIRSVWFQNYTPKKLQDRLIDIGLLREKLGLSDFKFHNLHKTFGSVLAQNRISTTVTQKLLKHSSQI